MPRIERTAEITWDGNLARGAGAMSAGSGAFSQLGYSLPTRIGQPEGKTSPEELLAAPPGGRPTAGRRGGRGGKTPPGGLPAAPRGGGLTMGLAGELSGSDTPPGRLEATCRIVMDEVEGRGHQIVASHVDVVVAADGLDDDALQAHVVKADESCPFSELLRRAGAEVHVSARLAA